MRIAMGVEYDGGAYHGWQTQITGETIQQQVELAVSKVANHPVDIICAGRTDTGVHATGQVIHFDSQAERSPRSWVLGTNTNLPDDIVVLWAKQVPEDFHARFEATARRYRYIIANRFTRSAIHAKRVTWWFRKVDINAMQEAAKALIGEHDFTSYRATQCQAKSPVRTIYSIELSRNADYIYIDIHANAFLHHMVRNIVGVLLTIGEGEQAVDWAKTILDARDRRQGGVTAPPHGLYLAQIEYPSKYNLPAHTNLPVIA